MISRRFLFLNTNLEELFNAIIRELEHIKELKIVNKLNSKVNEHGFWTVTAVRRTVPRAFIGALREVAVTITGEPNDFLIEGHTGSWFSNMVLPGVGGFIIGGPLVGVTGASLSTLLATRFERELKKRITELINEKSTNKIGVENLEVF